MVQAMDEIAGVCERMEVVEDKVEGIHGGCHYGGGALGFSL